MTPVNRKVITTLVISILLLALAWIIYSRLQRAKPESESKRLSIPPVMVELPLQKDLEYKLTFSGDVNPAMQANVFSKVTGNIDHLYADMGEQVRAGQMLALIDTAALGATVQQAFANFQNARSTYNRTKLIAASNLASQQDLDNATSQMEVARAAYHLARTQLDYAKIRAPFAGVITKRYLDIGSVVSTSTIAASATTQSNSVLFTIMDLDSVKILINVLDADVPKLATVKEARVMIDALPGKTFRGRVTRSSQAISTTTRTMTVEIVVPNKDHTIKPGMFARVDLLLGQHPNALTVPAEAVLRDKDGSYVYTISADTVAHRVAVSLGVEDSNRVEVTSGLTGSEEVVIAGESFVKDKGKVRVQK